SLARCPHLHGAAGTRGLHQPRPANGAYRRHGSRPGGRQGPLRGREHQRQDLAYCLQRPAAGGASVGFGLELITVSRGPSGQSATTTPKATTTPRGIGGSDVIRPDICSCGTHAASPLPQYTASPTL